ncbi:MAG TPA: DUF2255 family protein [Candidatus Limnocylindrales bacterium]|nr:DUF2255 family protein [Candidatus Limnocylindrales bacterium]
MVVSGGTAYVASYHGPRGRWYRELLGQGSGALHVGGRRVPVRAVPSPAAADAVVGAFQAKYAGDPALPAMAEPDVLATILRLEPLEAAP